MRYGLKTFNLQTLAQGCESVAKLYNLVEQLKIERRIRIYNGFANH